MKTIDEASQKYANSNFENCSYNYDGDDRLTDFDKIKVSFNKGVEFAQRWIPVDEELPEYDTDVLVRRPNKYSGNTDILIARLHKSKQQGNEYGQDLGLGYCRTYKDYWSLPAIVLLKTITHWRPIELK